MNFFIAGTDLACALFILVISATLLYSDKVQQKYRFYFLSLFALLLSCIADSIAYIMDEIGGNYWLHFYSNLFSYIGIDVVLLLFVNFIFEKIREVSTLPALHAVLIQVVLFLDMLLICIGAYTGQMFRIENEMTVTGPWEKYIGIVQLFVSLYLLGQLFLLRKKLPKRLLYTVSSFFLLSILSFFAEIINPALLLSYEASSILFLIIFVLVVREDLQAAALSEKIMYEASVTDNLTGLPNRRAYEIDTAHYTGDYPEDFVYLSMDVNGLKKINDTIGHAAGDELIIGAAQCLQRTLGAYGKVYRMGGDEFTAIIRVPEEDLTRVVQSCEDETAHWQGTFVDSMSISIGHVKAPEIQGTSLHDVAVLADKRMYTAKAAFYKKKGIDRRGQFEAHVALCNLYTKILKINLTTDTFSIINMDPEEQDKARGFSDRISQWLETFGKNGFVHPDDLNIYLVKTSPEYMKKYFRKNKTSLTILYRRKHGDQFRRAMMEIIPANDYRDNNQSLFLYVKDFDM